MTTKKHYQVHFFDLKGVFQDCSDDFDTRKEALDVAREAIRMGNPAAFLEIHEITDRALFRLEQNLKVKVTKI